jgi:hypothetical protein
MVTSAQALKKYGDPNKQSAMIMWDVPGYLEIGVIPKKIYCNKDIIKPLAAAFQALIATGHVKELKTWDGCFNIRKKRGLGSMSLHSWGLAIDLNCSDNALGKTYEQLIAEGKKPFSEGFLQCFRNAGFDCGGDWKSRPDRMHMQLSKLP